MKVFPFQISKPNNDALIYQEDKASIFYDKYHQHVEIQLSYIVEGEGTLVVADSINDYKSGDIIVIGSYIPHVFRSDSKASKQSTMLTLFFSKDSFGSSFFESDELSELGPFFKRSTFGFKVTSHKQKIQELFLQLKPQSKFRRFLIFMELLSLISKTKFQRLSSFVYKKNYSDSEGKRMSAVMAYTMTHFQNTIELNSIAQVASMSKNAFCTYFKKRTNKTYVQFLNELRIEHASKLLLAESELAIADVAEQSGFHNISNFNRQFKAYKKMTPSQYLQLR